MLKFQTCDSNHETGNGDNTPLCEAVCDPSEVDEIENDYHDVESDNKAFAETPACETGCISLEGSEIDNTRCVICDKQKIKNTKQLYQIGKERAELLFNATHFFQDSIYTKTAILHTPGSFVNAKIKYHPACLRTYELKYKGSQKVDLNASNESSKLDKSMQATNAVVDIIMSLESKIYLGVEYHLTDVANFVKEKYGADFSVKHAKIQSCLIEYFDVTVCFVYSKEEK